MLGSVRAVDGDVLAGENTTLWVTVRRRAQTRSRTLQYWSGLVPSSSAG